ncbi:f-box and wd40 domain [Moniliophthora roreri MCA 2997]|uniref:F-box and wd40 domain n=1 Tax=Moniliophthora roreri (strain MCA 2997) TaxID=1381753 RepID=V2X349_MONRO|nr:f-box and wd40 domain [Moniliophthora roreri MCA 2997]
MMSSSDSYQVANSGVYVSSDSIPNIINIKEISVHGVPASKSLGTVVTVQCQSQLRSLRTPKFDGKKGDLHRWMADFEIRPSSLSESITFKLIRPHTLRKDKTLATVVFRAEELVDKGQEIKKDMHLVDSSLSGSTVISLLVTVDAGNVPTPTIGDRKESIDNLETGIQEIRVRSEAIGKIIEPAEPLLQVLNGLAELHPIAQAAWLSVSGIYQVVKSQYSKDQAIISLYEMMMEAYAMATQNDGLNQHGDFSDIFNELVRQTQECRIFLSKYIHKGRLLQAMDLKAQTDVKRHTKAFEDLKGRLTDTQANVTLVSVMNIRNGMSLLEIDVKLRRLKPPVRSPEPQARCLRGTRRTSLATIQEWALEGDQSILWLSGVAGSGKSSLMGTLYAMTREMGHNNRLGAYIRFDRALYTDPRHFVRELAYQLAEFDDRLGQAIARAVVRCSRIPVGLEEQLDEYVQRPLQSVKQMHDEGPIFILVDGLDESARDTSTTDFRAQLLSLFEGSEWFKRFPFLRIAIASRPEEDIKEALLQHDHILHLPLDITSSETQSDIAYFLSIKFSEPRFRVLNQEQRSRAVEELSLRASGLFIWAATVVKFISDDVKSRLNAFLETQKPQNAPQALRILYETALDSLVSEGDEDIRDSIRIVLGLILATRVVETYWWVPCTTSMLEVFVHNWGASPSKEVDVKSIVEKLGSVLIEDDNFGLRLMHKSFDEFLSTSTSSWYIDVEEHLANMAYATISCVLYHIEKPDMEVKEAYIFLKDLQYATSYWLIFYERTGVHKVLSSPALYHLLRRMLQRCLLRTICAPFSFSFLTCISKSRYFVELASQTELGDRDPFFWTLLSHAYDFAFRLVDTAGKPSLETFFTYKCQHHSKELRELGAEGQTVVTFEINNIYVSVLVQMADGNTSWDKITEILQKKPLPPVVCLNPEDASTEIRFEYRRSGEVITEELKNNNSQQGSEAMKPNTQLASDSLEDRINEIA